MRSVTVLLSIARRVIVVATLLAANPAFADVRMDGVRVGHDFGAPLRSGTRIARSAVR